MHDRGRIMSEEERLELVDWFSANYLRFNTQICGRVDYTLKPYDKSVPMVVWRIKKRLIEKEKLQRFVQEPTLKDYFWAIMPGGKINPHLDPNLKHFIHVRFNVFIQLPINDSGTYYGKQAIDSKEGHYTLCRSGIDRHWINPIKGNRPRLTLSFGYLIPRNILDKIYPVPSENFIIDAGIETPTPLEIENYRLYSIRYYGFEWWWTDHYVPVGRDLIEGRDHNGVCRNFA